jgi:hypothetical protein
VCACVFVCNDDALTADNIVTVRSVRMRRDRIDETRDYRIAEPAHTMITKSLTRAQTGSGLRRYVACMHVCVLLCACASGC